MFGLIFDFRKPVVTTRIVKIAHLHGGPRNGETITIDASLCGFVKLVKPANYDLFACAIGRPDRFMVETCLYRQIDDENWTHVRDE